MIESYDEMLDSASSLKSTANNMDTILNEVKSLLSKITDASVWSGIAASEAKNNFDILSSKFPEFVTTINEYANYLTKIVNDSQLVDKQIIESLDV